MVDLVRQLYWLKAIAHAREALRVDSAHALCSGSLPQHLNSTSHNDYVRLCMRE